MVGPASPAKPGCSCVQHGADQLLVGGNGQCDQVAALGVQGQLGVGSQFLQQGQRRRGVDLDQPVYFQLRRVLRGRALAEPLQSAADDLVLFVRGPDDQVLDFAVDRERAFATSGCSEVTSVPAVVASAKPCSGYDSTAAVSAAGSASSFWIDAASSA